MSPTTRVSTSGSQDLGTITFSLTEAELVEAGRWQFWVRLRERRRQMLLAGLAILVLAGGYATNGMSGLIQWTVWSIGFAVVFPLAMTRFAIPRHVRAAMKTDARFQSPWRIAIGADALHLSNAQGDTRYFWNGFDGRFIGRRVLLLSTSASSYVPVPLSALTPRDIEAVDMHLRAVGIHLA